MSLDNSNWMKRLANVAIFESTLTIILDRSRSWPIGPIGIHILDFRSILKNSSLGSIQDLREIYAKIETTLYHDEIPEILGRGLTEKYHRAKWIMRYFV